MRHVPWQRKALQIIFDLTGTQIFTFHACCWKCTLRRITSGKNWQFSIALNIVVVSTWYCYKLELMMSWLYLLERLHPSSVIFLCAVIHQEAETNWMKVRYGIDICSFPCPLGASAGHLVFLIFGPSTRMGIQIFKCLFATTIFSKKADSHTKFFMPRPFMFLRNGDSKVIILVSLSVTCIAKALFLKG